MKRAAIFIDGSNVSAACKMLEMHIDYAKLYDLFASKFELTRALYYTALTDNSAYDGVRPLVDWLSYNRFTVVTKPAKVFTARDGSVRVKGNMDMEIAVDMIQYAEQGQRLILFTGDGDFRCVLEYVQKKYMTHVTVVSTIQSRDTDGKLQFMIANELRQQADEFIDLANIRGEISKVVGTPKGMSSSFPSRKRLSSLTPKLHIEKEKRSA